MKSRKKLAESFAPASGAPSAGGTAARRTARIHDTPIYVWKNGKVVAEKP